MKKPLVLVDGSSYLYRAYHALPSLTNSKGFPTGAIYGMINMLKRLITDFQPDHMAVIFDATGKTFRDDLYPAYKATRSAMPEELILQIAPLHALIQEMGIPLIMIDGVEADDVIGTLAKKNTKAGGNTLISTGDKDLAQLVDEHVTLINTMTNTQLDIAGVKEKFGVTPAQIIDYLTLTGDTSDNIPGVAKVGPKTAAKWLEEYGTLENLVKHQADITGKIGDNLREFIDTQLSLTQTLVTIKCDVDFPYQLNELTLQPPAQEKLISAYKELEFKTWLSQALSEEDKHSKTEEAHYETVLTEKLFAEKIALLKKAKYIVVDTETTSLNYMAARLVGLSFSIEKNHGFYIPFGHDYLGAPQQLSAKEVLSELKSILENKNIKKIGQHIKYDLEVLANHDIHLSGIYFDTLLASYVLDSSSNTHNMDALALKYLGRKTITFEDIAGKGAKQLTFNQVEVEKAGVYSAEDAEVTHALYETFLPNIDKEKGIAHIFYDIEMPLIAVLAGMERHGVFIDPQKLIAQSKSIEKRLITLEKDVFQQSGATFNMNSPKQLQAILFEQLKLPVIKKTPSGQPSTAEDVLEELSLDFPLPRLIIEYRQLSKLKSTYTDRLVKDINPQTGRVHTSYHQTGTGTGRLSSSDPNLQNIPVRSEEGRKIREAFIAPPKHQLISADYSQIELRLMAHISKDPTLLKAFADNKDIHQATAAEVFDVPLTAVTADMRRHAKAINFGLLYGMSAFGLKKQLNVSRQEAENYIKRYFERYPQVQRYMETVRATAKKQGYVETLFGRRLYIPNIQSGRVNLQKAAERAAINAPLQGSAADIIKIAMINVADWLKTEKVPATLIMQVHDELVLEVAEKEVDTVINKVRALMSHAVTLDVPLLVSIGHGDNWDAASAH